MNWLQVNKETYEKVQLINPHKGIYLLNFSPTEYTPLEDEPKEINCKVISVRVEKLPSTIELKQLLLDLQGDYDKSQSVNRFNLGELKCWLDKETRVGLINSINIQKDSGALVTTLWLNGLPYQVSIDYALSFLRQLELYAVACYNNTQKHIAEIKAILNRDALFEYDITEGYPTPLTFDFEQVIKI